MRLEYLGRSLPSGKMETQHNEVQPSIRKKPKVSLRFIIGVALLTAAIVTWMVLLVLSRSIPVYSLTGNGPSMADFLEYHNIRFIGYAATAAGTGGLLMIGAELWIQHTRKAKRLCVRTARSIVSWA